MGTRGTLHIYDENNKHLVSLYRQMDSYIDGGWGDDLVDFLKNRKIVNGYSLDDRGGSTVSNGMSCLAASIISHFKEGIGGFYITDEDERQAYNYFVKYVKDGRVSLSVEFDEGKKTLSLYDEQPVVCHDDKRKELLVRLSRTVSGKTTQKNIRFRNNDVPVFLRRLDSFEARSRQTNVLVK